MPDDDSQLVEKCHEAAIDKLQTLFPGKKITTHNLRTISIPTTRLDSPTPYDIYELGLIDEEIPAMKRQDDDHTITFRI